MRSVRWLFCVAPFVAAVAVGCSSTGSGGGQGAGGNVTGSGGVRTGGATGTGGNGTGGTQLTGAGGTTGAGGAIAGTGGRVTGAAGADGNTPRGGVGGSGAAGSGGRGGGSGTAGAGGGAVTNGALFVAPARRRRQPQGRLAQPLRTSRSARDARARDDRRDDVGHHACICAGGTYPQTSTLTFSNADSGKNGFYVKYLAYPGEQPLITGGQPITGWTVSDPAEQHLFGHRRHGAVPAALRQRRQSHSRAQPQPGRERRGQLQPAQRLATSARTTSRCRARRSRAGRT